MAPHENYPIDTRKLKIAKRTQKFENNQKSVGIPIQLSKEETPKCLYETLCIGIMLTAAIPEVKVLDVTYHVNLTESLALKWYCPLGEKCVPWGKKNLYFLNYSNFRYEILGTHGSGKYALITM